jgi:acetoacetyl-CoA synthetase
VHGVGGTLLQHLKELSLHTDVKAGTRLFYFTTCGWMMWNWYVSGLALGATLILYDGSPFHPEQGVLFDLAESEKIDVFGASAKYFAAAEKFGLKPKQTQNLESIKGILSTGSPLVPESFDYLYRDVSSTARVSSISGGTDIVSCFALGCPILPVWRGELQCAGLGMDVSFLDENGSALASGKGELVCATSFPSMPVSFWKDPDGQRYFNAYFANHPNKWAHGDFGELCVHQLQDGTTQTGVMIHGRSDAVLNPNGVRIGTAEIYRQVEKVDAVFESLAIGQKWQGDERIVLFVKLRDQVTLTPELEDEIRKVIRSNTSPRHVPAKIIAVADIPRTRSGKIVELAVRAIVHGEPVKNTEALELFANLKELET